MKLYFFRHAHAEPHNTREDHERMLTEEGIAAARRAANVMLQLDMTPLTIYTSPRVRAKQTAMIAAEVLGAEVVVTDEVNFGFDATGVERLLSNRPQTGDAMFVGHEPYFSETIRQICSGLVEMKKAGLARVDVDETISPLRGTLVWLLTPKIFEVFNNQL